MHVAARFRALLYRIVHIYPDWELGTRGVAPADGFLEDAALFSCQTSTPRPLRALLTAHCGCLPHSHCVMPTLVDYYTDNTDCMLPIGCILVTRKTLWWEVLPREGAWPPDSTPSGKANRHQLVQAEEIFHQPPRVRQRSFA
jgi:hypothetical protein